MENINAKSQASLGWILSSVMMGLAASAPPCFAHDSQNASLEPATVLAAIIAGLSAISAVIGAVVANKSARAAMKSAYTAAMSAQKKYGVRLPAPVTDTVNKNIDWVRNFIEAADTPLGVVLTILFSLTLGIGLSILLPRADAPLTIGPASDPATPASPAPVSAPSPEPAPKATPASTAPVSAPSPPTAATATPDQNEVATLVARGRAYLSNGDVASARMLLRRAAESDDPQAALALAGTYDPAELKRLGISNFRAQADPAKAREWYRRALELGSAEAASRLQGLSKVGRSFGRLNEPAARE
jgi:tetratricopeptide (TPR) repeat protein